MSRSIYEKKWASEEVLSGLGLRDLIAGPETIFKHVRTSTLVFHRVNGKTTLKYVQVLLPPFGLVKIPAEEIISVKKYLGEV